MFNKLPCKIWFHIAVRSLRKCYKSVLVSFKTFLKSVQNQLLSSEICLGSSHEIGCSLPIVFQRNWPRKFPRNSREIGRFFREFVPENPAKFDFFFRDLPEALIHVPVMCTQGDDWFRECLCDIQNDNKNASKQALRHLNLPNHSKQHMAVCSLSLHQESMESCKTLEQKSIFQYFWWRFPRMVKSD